MSTTAAEHNALYGPGLTKRVLDAIGTLTAAQREVTAWSITKHLAPSHWKPRMKNALYDRVQVQLKALETTADIQRTYRWNAELKRGAYLITLPNVRT